MGTDRKHADDEPLVGSDAQLVGLYDDYLRR